MKRLATSLVFGVVLACAAQAQEFPSRTIRIVVPNPPGGTVDIVARAVAQGLGPALGRNVIVEIKPGGNNIIGTENVARAAPDGHTILLAGTHVTINPLLRKLPYDGLKAFAPVALLASTPNVIAVNPAGPVKSLAELIALARDRKGGLNCATSPSGNGIHLTAERFRALAGIDLNFIPYQGGIQSVLAAVAGQTEMVVAPLSDAAPHIASGKLRVLAVTSSKRFEGLPDVPTVAESGFPGFEAVQWFGAMVPAATPKPVIHRLSVEMRRALENPQAQAIFGKLGISTTPLDEASFARFLQDETLMFSAAIRDAHIQAE